MSLIGLLTATEKQVHLGQLHETHTVAYKNNWRVPESRESPSHHKSSLESLCPQVIASPSEMVAGGRQCASRSTITPNKTCAANIYKRSLK